MARQRMITRTIEQTTAEVMCLDVTSAEVSINTWSIGGKWTDDELLKKFKKVYDTDVLKVVHIEAQETTEVLLGMPEEEFIQLAKVLPPR